MGKRSPRLQFTEEERAAPELKKSIRKADKKADKLEKAEAKIPKNQFRFDGGSPGNPTVRGR